MIKFVSTIADDQPQILEWAKADPYHSSKIEYSGPAWWLTGVEGSLLAGGVDDESGPVLYYRFDREGELVRMHCQFAPVEQVNKQRVVLAIQDAVATVSVLFKAQGYKGIVFESTSGSLIRFMNKLGFKPLVESPNDFVLVFQEN